MGGTASTLNCTSLHCTSNEILIPENAKDLIENTSVRNLLGLRFSQL
jgi:hypothetical protein